MSGSCSGCELTPFCLIYDTTQASINQASVNCSGELLRTTEGFDKSLCLPTAVSTPPKRSEAWIHYCCFVWRTTSWGARAQTVTVRGGKGAGGARANDYFQRCVSYLFICDCLNTLSQLLCETIILFCGAPAWGQKLLSHTRKKVSQCKRCMS